MKGKVLFGFLLFVVGSCAGQTNPPSKLLVLWDNFNHSFLDPSRWVSTPACFSENSAEQECVRQIRDGKLYLAHRNYGDRDTDMGFQFGEVHAYFANPSTFKGISAEIVVTNYRELPCQANPEFGAAAHINGTFFNTGTGNPSDDVGAVLALGRSFSDPPGQLNVFGQINQGNNYFFYLGLGTVAIGTPIAATLTWDQPNHQFLVSWTNLITKVTTNSTMPYSLTDTAVAVNPSKRLTVATFPANCTAEPSWVYMEATFDNVFVAP